MAPLDPNGNAIRSASDVGALIRKQRRAQGLRQAEAAALCGVGTRFLSELENGKEGASLGKALRVLRGLGVEVLLRARGGPP